MPPTKQIDLTRLSRSERRRFLKQTGHKVPGRNLPFVKGANGIYTHKQFNEVREKELIVEQKLHENKAD